MASPRRSWVRRLAALVLLGAASVPLLPSESPACSSPAPELLEVRAPADAAQGAAPGAIEGVEVMVDRGVGPTDTGCGREMQTSCDDLGRVSFAFAPAIDPDSPRDEVGYVLELVDGTPPDGLGLRAEPLVDGAGDVALSFTWMDGAEDEQEAIAFTVTIHAVDVDGHEGPRSAPIEVFDPGR